MYAILPSDELIVKDLGILRLKDGVLPCPFCGEYPEVSYTDEYDTATCGMCRYSVDLEQFNRRM